MKAKSIQALIVGLAALFAHGKINFTLPSSMFSTHCFIVSSIGNATDCAGCVALVTLVDQTLIENEDLVLDRLDDVCYLDIVPQEDVERCVFYIHE